MNNKIKIGILIKPDNLIQDWEFKLFDELFKNDLIEVNLLVYNRARIKEVEQLSGNFFFRKIKTLINITLNGRLISFFYSKLCEIFIFLIHAKEKKDKFYQRIKARVKNNINTEFKNKVLKI